LKLVRKHKNHKPFKQLTLDSLPSESDRSLPETRNKQNLGNVTTEILPFRSKQIRITQLVSNTKNYDELNVDADFRLDPSKKDFSKIRYTIWFDGQKAHSDLIEIPQSLIASDEFQIKRILDLRGMVPGIHTVKIELCDLFSPSCTSKETTIEYKPLTKEERFRIIPTVKKTEGVDISILSNGEKEVFREIKDTLRKEQISKRDKW
jgi:hypothetical protein